MRALPKPFRVAVDCRCKQQHSEYYVLSSATAKTARLFWQWPTRRLVSVYRISVLIVIDNGNKPYQEDTWPWLPPSFPKFTRIRHRRHHWFIVPVVGRQVSGLLSWCPTARWMPNM